MVRELYTYKVIKGEKKMVSAFSKFHGNRYLKVPCSHIHAVQSMASAPWPSMAPPPSVACLTWCEGVPEPLFPLKVHS